LTWRAWRNGWLKSRVSSPRKGSGTNRRGETVLKERTVLSNRLERFKGLASEIEDTQGLYEMAVEESDEATLSDLSAKPQTFCSE